MENVWIEKYRPKNFSEIFGQKEIVERAIALTNLKSIPHLLFAGPPGTGKSTLALIIAKTIHKEKFRANWLELNSSDERGIDVIRGKVKEFARSKSLGAGFKIIFLDECDALTKDAQQALRRMMEHYSQTCRFILSCNYITRIIEPIQSRCAIFRFKSLDGEAIKAMLKAIAKNENLTIETEALEKIAEYSEGDARRAVNVLQSCAALSKNISLNNVVSTIAASKPKEIQFLIKEALKGNFVSARKILRETILNYGLSGLDLVKLLQKEILDLPIETKTKLEMLSLIAEVEFRIVQGSDELIQLEAFLAKISSFNMLNS